jgi:hypothetical protein
MRLYGDWVKTGRHHYISPAERGKVWFNIKIKEFRTLENFDAISEYYKARLLAQSRTIELPNTQRSLMVKSE